MNKTRIITWILLVIIIGFFLGGWLMSFGWFLLKLIVGILGLGLLLVGYYLFKLKR